MTENSTVQYSVERQEPITRLKRISRMLGTSPIGLLVVVILLVIPFVPPFNQEHLLRWLVGAALIAAQTIAFDFTTGYINVVNFGFAAFLGVGAYTSALLAVELGVTPWIGIFLGVIPAAVLGFLTGILTLRLRGIFAALPSISNYDIKTYSLVGPKGFFPCPVFSRSYNHSHRP